MDAAAAAPLGLRANLAQFSLLVVVNAFVGAMVGLERSILPLIAEQEFRLAARAAVLSFIVVFGAVKAATNYFAGRVSDSMGRKAVLVSGWLVAAPVPFLLMWAPSWTWILGANVLPGISQGLTWSMTVIMKIDLAGPGRRGLALGLNESAPAQKPRSRQREVLGELPSRLPELQFREREKANDGEQFPLAGP